MPGVLTDVLVVLAWVALGFCLGRLSKDRSADVVEAQADRLHARVQHLQAELHNAVELNRVLMKQRDEARAERDGSDRLAVQYVELLEVAEHDRDSYRRQLAAVLAERRRERAALPEGGGSS